MDQGITGRTVIRESQTGRKLYAELRVPELSSETPFGTGWALEPNKTASRRGQRSPLALGEAADMLSAACGDVLAGLRAGNPQFHQNNVTSDPD